jgi:hypothetical protein
MTTAAATVTPIAWWKEPTKDQWYAYVFANRHPAQSGSGNDALGRDHSACNFHLICAQQLAGTGR